jgi:hypothetical protein
MKIVNREEFLKLKGKVLYSKFEPNFFEQLTLKDDSQTFYENDWLCLQISDAIHSEENEDKKFDDICDNLIAGQSIPMDFEEMFGRDALFEKEMLFAIWEASDLKKFAITLSQILADTEAREKAATH